MKKALLLIVGALILATVATGCASDRPFGSLYTKSTYDVVPGPTDLANAKVGTATANNFFGIVGIGDCSIKAAAEAGGITKISHVDRNVDCIIGISTITTQVYGK